VPGAQRFDAYVHLLKGKRVGIFANHTSLAGDRHVVDTLRKMGVNIAMIFGPEHGFRGTADAGDKVGNYVDEATGIPVVSLYGAKRRPSAEDLKDIDVMVFDIQDVGIRYYTYISSLEEYMEAAFTVGRPLIVLDRPNPNGHYVDGPVLDRKYRSFVGMQPVPVVYGMTIGEYAKMLIGEKWIKEEAVNGYDRMRRSGHDPLTVIPCGNYDHKTVYHLPVRPSPNLPDMTSIYLYSSTCYFEGTVLSEGRGTPTPFQVFGHPSLPKNLYAFTPVSMPGAKEPKLKDQLCYGWDLRGDADATRRRMNGRIQLSYLIEAYRLFPEKDKFFLMPKTGDPDLAFFNKLAGNNQLMAQIKAGAGEEEIKKSWEEPLKRFRGIRAKYLIYKD
jgi:uncharacterized protein YbbC (DUF1343 family)